MKKLLLLVIIMPILGFSQTQIGQDINGEQGATFNDFGSSVSSSSNGTIVAIGSPLTNANGVKSGQVSIYENISGVWTQIGNDINGKAAEDEFGHSVSLSSDGNIVAIGAIKNDDNGTNSGQVIIYENISGVWTQIGNDINGEAAEDEFGSSVSLSSDGTIVAIGAIKNDGNSSNSGHVRIYENINEVWTQVGIDIDGEAAGDASGWSVSLSSDGSIIAIGAPINDGNGILSGHVRIYENISGVWTQIGSDIDGEAERDRSGSSVNLSSDGSIVAIGAPRNDGNGAFSGHVRVYENIGGAWTQIGNDIDGEDDIDYFGKSVSLSSDGSILAIGSAERPNDDGYVRIYENIGGFWSLIGNILEGEEVVGANITLSSGFNVSLSSDGSMIVIGATENNGNGFKSGHVRVYKNVSGFWSQIGNDIDGETTYSPDSLGNSTSISLDGNIIAVASNSKDNGIDNIQAGQVVIYENLEGVWTQLGNKINGEASFDFSGSSVSLSSDGGIVAIGASGNDGNGERSGHVRVYQNLAGVWTQIGNDIDGEEAFNFSGSEISLSSNGNILAIGVANNEPSNVYGSPGYVRVFENIGGVWTQIGNDITGEAVFDQSGFSVSLSSDGSIVAIGAPGNSGNGGVSGHVRVYQNITGVWTQIGNDIDGEEAEDRLGFNVSLSSDGNIVAIGSRESDGIDPELVRVYKNINDVWIQLGNDIEGEAVIDFYGGSLSLSPNGDTVAIGFPNIDGNTNRSGQVRIYHNIDDNWTQLGNYINGKEFGDLFGQSLALSANGIVVIGSPGNDSNGDNAGQVRVFSFASELARLEVVEDIAGNSNNINITAEQLNSIIGVSGAVEGVNYTSALSNGTFVDENNPTASEIQAIIDQVNATLGINNDAIFTFIIYPNPTKTQFTIQLQNNRAVQNVNIYNNLGQQVLTSKKSIINTSNLASGIYMVEIETNKGKASKKLIIE